MNTRICNAVILFFAATTLVVAQTTKLAFIQNKGQWDGDVTYKADLPGGQALATSRGMLVGLFDTASVRQRVEWGMKIEDHHTGMEYFREHPLPPDMAGHGWRFHFLNADPNPVIENKGESADFYNFWVGDEQHQASKVRSYEELTYRNLYKNIDVRYYTSPEGYLENDIIIKPYADTRNLSFELEGIDEIALINGNLVLTTTCGKVTVPAPVSYLIDDQGKKTPINISYTLENKIIGFIIPAYDQSQTLVIDPIAMRWATYATNASSSDTHNHGTGLDAAGNIYIAGRINSTGLITVGAFQSTAGGGMDLLIGKYVAPSSPGGAGTRVWQTYLGGTGTDNDIAIQMGTDGYAYVAASTVNNLSKTYGTGFTAGGWTQRTGTGGLTQGLIVKVDLAGNGAIPGPATPSGTTYTQGNSAKTNGLIMRIANDFNTISWIKNVGSDVSAREDEVFSISAIDAAGDIYIAGSTTASGNISYNNPSTQTTISSNKDGWILKMNSSGTVQWSRYFNGSSSKDITILSMEVTTSDTNLIVGGITTGLAAANITAGTVQTTIGGGQDLFVAKLSKTGAMTQWGTYFGGSGTEVNMMGLNTDQNEDIYFLGYTASTNYPTAANPIQSTNYGSNDAVFTKLNSSGTAVIYSSYYGGAADDNDPLGQRGILFSTCKAYLSVTAASNNIPLTSGALTTTKSSSTSVPEPVILTMANPPDIVNNDISTSQIKTCGQTPTTLSAGVASYNIANVVRNGSTQTIGTAGAYPSGLPSVTSYQWQKSIDYTNSWVNIAGATSQNYSPPAIYQTTYFRRVISGDYCSIPDSVVVILMNGGPTLAPTVTCAASTVSFFSNISGGTGTITYQWWGPNGFTSTAANPQIFSATNAINGTYTVTATDANGCIDTKAVIVDFNSCTYMVVLSVSLLNFEAEKTETTTTLKWQTANERNSDVFEVERTTSANDWTRIGIVQAAGNSSKILSYNFIDEHPVHGMNFYRLKVRETGGGYKYTEVKSVLFDERGRNNIISAVPNPFGNTLQVNYFTSSGGNVSVKLIDAVGRELETKELVSQKGENAIRFDTGNFARGVYFIGVSADGVPTNYTKIVKD
jgi:hypothetical protein